MTEARNNQSTVVVTGAASGIGAAVVHRLLKDGRSVLAVDRAREVRLWADRCDVLVLDLADPDAPGRVAAEAGQVAGLVNAAGISKTQPREEITREDWQAVLDVNVTSQFFLTSRLSELMSDGSAVVNVASVAGRMATNVLGYHYNASKAAVIAQTKTFAHELGPAGIRVNAVCPGVTDTPMLTGIFEINSRISGESTQSLVDSYLTRVPLGRLAEPCEIAAVVAFLLSNDASYVHGQSLNVCGGLVMS